LGFAEERLLVNCDRKDAVSAVHKMDDINKGLDRVHRDAAYHGRFFGVDFRNNNA